MKANFLIRYEWVHHVGADNTNGGAVWGAWRGDATGGLISALFILPTVLGCGIIVFQPLGPDYQASGIRAAFGAAIIAALFRGMLGGRSLHVNAPRASQAALLAGLLTEAMRADVGAPVEALMAVTFLTLAVGGAFQLLLGALRWGDALKYIPQPVIAGFVNGFALVILLQQLPNLFGLPHRGGADAGFLGLIASINPWALGMGMLALVGVWRLGERNKLIPGPLIGLAGGALVYQLTTLALTALGMDAGGLGAMVKAPPPGAPFILSIGGVMDLLAHPLFAVMAPSIIATGLTLGVVSSIQSLLSAAAADSLLRGRLDSNRELLVQGGSNLLSGLIGGTSTGGSPLYTRIAIHNGARLDRANLFTGLALLAAAMGLGPALEMVPASVMAAMVIVVVVRPDDWTMQLVRLLLRPRQAAAAAARDEMMQNLGIVITVTLMVAFADVLAALAAGMALSVMVYLRRAAASVVRRTFYGDRAHSLTERSPLAMELLEREGGAIAVMELHGPVFFGSAENMARTAEKLIENKRFLILDLSRVNDVESTGVLVLRRLDERLKQEGKTLLLSGMWKGRGLRALLRDMNFTAPEEEGRIFGDIDTALATAEDRLLEQLGGDELAEAELPLTEHPSLQGMTKAQMDLLSLTTRRMEFIPGESILTEGSPGDSQFLLVKGRVRVEKRAKEGGHSVRLSTIQAGAIFGEMAMLTGEPRSADIVADSHVVCHELTADDIAMLDGLDPAISFILLRNIATEVTIKVRRMSRAVAATE